ncbi:MAG: Smr/MutS family protein [Deltaproteobacteria bacterium]|nr:Smr/MutS family protein [Deltaproteobacteria bacterium]
MFVTELVKSGKYRVIDLHSFRPSETASVVEEYLAEAWARGFREVRIVHGRGIGAQRLTVRAVLARSPLVREFRDAPPEAGGWGATVVTLREGEPGSLAPPDPPG